jgi:hypothetical protein
MRDRERDGNPASLRLVASRCGGFIPLRILHHPAGSGQRQALVGVLRRWPIHLEAVTETPVRTKRKKEAKEELSPWTSRIDRCGFSYHTLSIDFIV